MNLFQSPEWEEFKLATGYQKSYRIDGVLVLQKSLPLGRTMLYSPMMDDNQKVKTQNPKFITKIQKLGEENKSIFYRAEFDIPTTNTFADRQDYESPITNHQPPITSLAFIKSFEEMQPEHTLILNIRQSEEEILAQMKPKGRYNIKVAEKSGIKIIEEDNTDNFFNLYSNMAIRHKITYREPGYFQKLFDITRKKDYSKVFTALHKDTPIASVIISFFGDRATYLFGGSGDEYRNLMAPYLLQWTAIREAKKRGCKEYDFFGVAPANQPDHPWRGVTDFKKKFGGQEVELLGSWDLVFRPVEYQAFKFLETIRRN